MALQKISFDEAIADADASFSKKHLILGNGFSIACRPDIFHYGSIFAEADFSGHPNLPHVFEALKTQDFEVAIQSLETSAALHPIYESDGSDAAVQMLADAAALKDILIETIARNHPESPADISEEEFQHCRAFLANFLSPDCKGYVFTLNYDLLLYWALMHKDEAEGFDHKLLVTNDGFGNDEDNSDTDYVVWRGEKGAHSARVHFLHGALHLFDAGHQLHKYTWIRNGDRLLEQSRTAMDNGLFPLFVAEGETIKKRERINHNAYLYQGLKLLGSNVDIKTHCYFIHGHSLAENDDHILNRLGRGKFKKMYLGVYGDLSSEANQTILKRARKIQAMRSDLFPLELALYDSESAHVWR